MSRRYGLLVGLLVAASLIIGAIYWAATPVDYRGTCLVRIALPPTSVVGSDYFGYSQALAVSEVELAETGPLYSDASTAAGLDAGSLRGQTAITPGPDDSYFDISVTNRDAGVASGAANALCDALVSSVNKQRSSEQATEIARLRDQVASLTQSAQKIEQTPDAQRTTADRIMLTAYGSAITEDQNFIAQLLSAAPDTVSVIARSAGGLKQDNRSLAVDLFIAGMIALVVGVVGATVLELRRREVL